MEEIVVKQVLSVATTTLLIIVILLAAALVGVRLFGIAPYTVLSGSMEPTYHVGSLIYVKPVATEEIAVGDPITYVMESGTVVTHRVIGIVENYGEDGSPGFKTKGDANNTEDGGAVHSRNVLGKPIFTIPLLGYIAYAIQSPPGSYIALGFCIVVVLMTFLPDLLDKLEAEEAAKRAENEKKDGEA